MSAFGELIQLLENDIPDCRKHLRDSHANLEKVAAYCEGNYVQATDKRHALEETKNYTTQSLASVAYQINMLATNFLRLLDLQMVQISEMESSINHLSQIVMIHKEKVARREIGELTTNKAVTKPAGVKNPGIIFPEQPERQVKYTRKPIDYNSLDNIGHGLRTNQSQQAMRTNSISATPKISATVPNQAPTTRPPTPPSSGYSTGSLRKSAMPSVLSPYRAPAPQFAPPSIPTVPSNYAPSYPVQSPAISTPLAGAGAMSRSGYAPGPVAMQNQHPLSRISQSGTPQPTISQPQLTSDRSSRHPYISDPIPIDNYRSSRVSQQPGDVSPPLPPPPNEDVEPGLPPQVFGYGEPAADYGADYPQMDYASRMSRMEQDEVDWIPPTYIEKVVAIYSYQQDKDDELTFDEGAVIYVVKKNDDGWWEGVMDGNTGLFPGNYVEPCI